MQTAQNFFLRCFFRGPPSEVTNFNTSPMLPPPFEIFFLDNPALNTEQKLSVKKERSTGVDFEIYRSGRVEKILTGSISGEKLNIDRAATITDVVQQKHDP